MPPETEYAMVMTTCESQETAEQLAEAIVTESLAACVQVVPITSFYRWKGELAREAERLLLIKTRADRYEELEAFIAENHTYDLPAEVFQ
jgi:periplasmic divalent cation tolerance protein